MTRKPTLVEAIYKHNQNASFVIRGEEVWENMEWLSIDQPKPSKEQIEQTLSELMVEWETAEYSRLRAEEYPSIQDQLDILFHGGFDAWKAEIQAIKDKYPKPAQ